MHDITTIANNILSKVKEHKKLLTITSIIVIVLMLLYSLALPKIININNYRDLIHEMASEKIRGTLKFGKLDLELPITGGFVLKTDYVKISDESGKEVVYAENVKGKISILPLIFRDMVIKDLHGTNLRVYATLDKDLKTNLEYVFIPPSPEDPFIPRFWGTKAKAEGYILKIEDNHISPSNNLILKGDQVRILNFTENKEISLKAKGKLNNKVDYKLFTKADLNFQEDFLKNNLEVKGTIDNLNIEEIKPYLERKDIQGKVDIDIDAKLNNEKLEISTLTQIKKDLILQKEHLKLKRGYLELKANLDPKNIQIHKLKTTINDIDSEIKGQIKQWQSKSPDFLINTSLNHADIKDLPETIPEIPETKELLGKIKLYKIKGVTKGKIKASGKASDPRLNGEITLKDSSLELPYKIKFSDINSIFEFKGTTVFAKNFLIPLPNYDLLQINGGYDFKNQKFQHLRISSTLVEVSEIKNIVLSLAKALELRLLVVKDIYTKGNTKFNIKLNGDINRPSLGGDIYLDINSFKISGFNKPIDSIKGKISLDKENIIANNLKVKFNKKSSLDINGSYNIYKEFLNHSKLEANNLNLNQIHNILITLLRKLQMPSYNLDDIRITGITSFKIKLKGPINSLSPHGKIDLKNITASMKGIPEPVNDINGQITFDNNIKINNLNALVATNRINVTGNASSKGVGEFRISVPSFKLKDLKEIALKLNTLNPEEAELLKQANIEGSLSGDIKLTSNGKTINPSAQFKILNSRIIHPYLHDVVNVEKGIINYNHNKLSVNDLTILTSGSRFNISGDLDDITKLNPNYNLKANSNGVTLNLIKRLSENKGTPNSLKDLISNIEKTTGNISINFNANNKAYDATVNLNDFSIYSKDIQNPVKDINGRIKLTDNLLSLDNLNASYGTSKIKIDGGITGITSTKPHINIETSGIFSPVDFNELLDAKTKQNLYCSQPFIFSGFARGNTDDWKLRFESDLPIGAQLGIKGLFHKPENVKVSFIVNGEGTTESIIIEKIQLDIGDSTFLAEGALDYSEKDLIELNDFHINIPSINLNQINDFLEKDLLTDNLSGEIKCDINANGAILNPMVTGYINLSNVSFPVAKAKDISLNIKLNGKEAQIEESNFNINNVIFKLSGEIINFRQLPIEFTNLKIYSPSLRLTDLIDIASDKSKKSDIDRLPVIVKNGYIKIDDAIIDKLITTDLTGNLTVCPNGMLQINNLNLTTAGGTAKGNIYVNLIKEEMGAQLHIRGVKANAAATILLDLPNEIFGNLNASLDFDSKGSDYDEILANAKGDARLVILNGRFTRLGTLEHLLTATNIINGGITGLNLNNILGSIIPMHTGNFQLLTGDFNVKEGILSTDNLITRGKNLSLEIAGNYNIAAEDADLTVMGSIPRNVSGLLGSLGKLNLETFTDFIPGLGFIPGVSKKRGLLDFIPGLGFIPGFGGVSNGEKVRNFTVELKGKLYDMSSVKNFRWTD